MTIGSFCLIKNELQFINNHLSAWLPFLDSMVFFDGQSTDGTLDIIRGFIKNHEHGKKIILVEDKDPKDLKEDYTRLSNEAMRACLSDLTMFLHPDMFPENGEVLKKIPEDIIAASVNMRSYAGEPNSEVYEIQGRGTKWKNIYRLRNPDLGAHYFGAYGAQNEDTYFSEITGNLHEHYGQDMVQYPYPIYDSGLIVKHYSDVRPYARRLDRMIKCLINQGYGKENAERIAPNHPRVSLKAGNGFMFQKEQVPELDGGY